LTTAKSARDRLLDAANRLFYKEGVHTVGIDRILAESGVAKRSLYTNFGSKDALVEAYLTRRHNTTTSRLTEAIAAVDDPREKILAVFDVQARTFSDPDFNGCAFMNADAEAEPGDVADRAATEFRSWIHTMFLELATGIGVPQPRQLARQLHALYDGGIIAARSEHDSSIAADTRAAAQALIDTYTGRARRQSPSS
jgi:AcrR family transcriptional regulator